MIEKDRSGTYCILFKNNKGLEITDITEIFSEFGTISSIKTGGDKTGYHFIRYKHLNEAVGAVEGLKNHPLIRLAYHSPKNQNGTNGAIPKKKINFKGKFSQNSTKKSQDDQNQTFDKSEDSMWDSVRLKSEETNLNKSMDSDQVSISSRVSMRNHNVGFNKNHSRGGSRSNRSNDTQHNVENNISEYHQGNSKKFNTNSPKLSESDGHFHSDLNINHLQEQNTVLAEEVVVANLHSNVTAAYILHVFEKYEPIAVTKIKTVPKSKYRFCHVYFKTREIAMKAEDEYDETALFGQKLIVLRPNRLIDEATNCGLTYNFN